MIVVASMYALASICFIVLIAAWLRFEYRRSVSLSVRWPWLAAVVLLQCIASTLAVMYDEHGLGNVLLHSIGGGAVGTLLFFYLLLTFSVSLSIRLQLATLFCFICTLGVLNELAEFTMELVGVGTFSFDSRDTWRDFVSNTSGAFVAWALVRTFFLLPEKWRSR